MVSWKCPSCANNLTLQDRSWSCSNGHVYDVAKEGYVNLLLAQHKNSKQPGDNKEMVAGRRGFLENGYYQPLANSIGNIFTQYLSTLNNQTQVCFFDAGCGEGYYMDQVSQACQLADYQVEFSGLDISKFAVQKAAKKYSNYHFSVASTFQLPLQNDSQDAVLQIFAPSSEAEIHRVLKAKGIWITVNPAANHLSQLKQTLYDTPTEHKTSHIEPDGMSLVKQSTLTFDIHLGNSQQRKNLLMMTPYYWSATQDKKQRLLENLKTVTTDFAIKVFAKTD